MPAAIWFWLVYVVMALACLGLFAFTPDGPRRQAAVTAVLLVLIGLLGWGLFGPPIR